MKNVQLKTKKQSTLVIRKNRIEDDFNINLSNSWIEAGLPIKALDNPGLKSFLQKGKIVRTCWEKHTLMFIRYDKHSVIQ